MYDFTEYCRSKGIQTPTFNIVSDRRGGKQFNLFVVQSGGAPFHTPSLVTCLEPLADTFTGRTAWSATVTIQGNNVAARYWYDGQFINNAKEDAAEVAMMRLNHPRAASTATQSYSGGGAGGNGRWGAR